MGKIRHQMSGPQTCKARIPRAPFLRVILVIVLTFIIISTIALFRGWIIDVHQYYVPTRLSGSAKIVALSDLHGAMLGKNQERIVSKIKEANPDIIVYLGDMIERSRASESLKALVILTNRLTQIAPVYYVDGNHEEDVRNSDPEIYYRLNTDLLEQGAVQLDNDILQLKIGRDCIVNLCGITTHYYWGEKENELVADLRKRDGINIMLCHYPETVLWRRAFYGGGLDLALCGHTHGGLIRVPFKGGVYAPEWGWWPLYDLGEYLIYSDTDWYHYGGEEGTEYWGTMIISGGLAGEHGVPRVNNPMEISIIDIRSDDI